MLYLITPDGIVSTLDAGLGDALVDARRGRPLARQPWVTQPPSGISPEKVLAVALRHGVDAGIGLVVHGGFIDQVLEPERLRAAERNQNRIAAQLQSIAAEPRHEDRDWHRRQRAIAEEARQAAAGSIRRAEEAAEELLEAPVKDRLTRAWERAGGLVPAS
ncbi:hypothetical protein [Citricoccus sp. I39-566]|uniref:hypothetical protein n=1 Tax=Citricoccus sp. I39-566 TaxID=3073268 RepID=UPI00286A1816|nr:hypothetical protein [Citricoccus sp. I39-566]WMY78235.1 hypothetical protein RE421_15670 [Citricoccus sp. I39-566]